MRKKGAGSTPFIKEGEVTLAKYSGDHSSLQVKTIVRDGYSGGYVLALKRMYLRLT